MSIYDIEHKSFFIKKKKRNFLVILFRFLIVLVFVLLWELFSRLGIINTFLFSSPSKVCLTIYDLFINGNLIRHILITLWEIFISFSITSFLSLVIACCLWKWKFLADILEPYLTVLNSLPKVALGPLIIIWIGADTKSIIFMAMMISIFVTILNIYNSFINTEEEYIKLMKSFKCNDFIILNKVIIPSNINNIVSSFKVNVSMTLIGVIMGELLVSKEGIGYLIMYGSQVFNINLVISGVIILGILSFIIYMLVEKISFKFTNKKETIRTDLINLYTK